MADNDSHIKSTAYSVALTVPLDHTLHYLGPDGVDLQAGDYVIAPLSGRQVLGCVWGKADDNIPESSLKKVSQRLDLPPMTSDMCSFLQKMSDYCLAPLGNCLKMALRKSEVCQTGRKRQLLFTTGSRPKIITAQRTRVLDCLKQLPKPPTRSELALKADVSISTIAGMLKDGSLEFELSSEEKAYPKLQPDFARPDLTHDQKDAANILSHAVEEQSYGCYLLYGVTGSGKTETYMEAIETALATGKQIAVLLPEISLTQSFIARIEARFGATPAQWHSSMSNGQRRRCWLAVARKQVQLVVGARSALFLPYADLGLIIVDEEHDPAYRQEDGVLYHARDMAVMRAHLQDCPIVLSSATPSLESWENCKSGRYQKLVLSERFGGATLPRANLVDLRATPPASNRWLAPPAIKAIEETLATDGQILLFLNRRGYAPLTLCRNCGYHFGCPRCDSWLVYHNAAGILRCHQCGYSQIRPASCPKCQQDKLAACGPGVERLFEEVKELFPQARSCVISSDTISDIKLIRKKFAQIESGDMDIIVGTQMMAKGHHFPNLLLVVVVDADLGLQGGDLRAAERTFQVIHQVMGRAGREKKSGHALIQTMSAEHPVMRSLAKNDLTGFLKTEGQERAAYRAAPFVRMAAIIISAISESIAEESAIVAARNLQAINLHGLEIFGPAPAPFARLRGKYRFRILIKVAKNAPLSETLKNWRKQLKLPASVRCTIDIDPRSFL